MEKNYTEEEMSLKDLILTLKREKMILIIITLISVILTSVYVFFIVDEQYESKVTGTIALSTSVTTKYGEYVLPSQNKMDYLNVVLDERTLKKVKDELNLNMSIESLRASIKIVNDPVSSKFEFIIQAPQLDLSKNIAKSITKVYLEVVNVKFKSLAIEYFLRDYEVRNKSDEVLLQKHEKIVSELNSQLSNINPATALKKTSKSELDLATDIAGAVEYEEVLNPLYEQLAEVVAKAENEKVVAKVNYEQNKVLYEELLKEHELVDKYLEGNETVSFNQSLEFIKSKIYVDNSIVTTDTPVYPQKALVIFISLVLGLILGSFIALFKVYWSKV